MTSRDVIVTRPTLPILSQLSFIGNLSHLQTIEKRKLETPHRPLIRISSTFFWHLSSDYDLHPIPSLTEKTQQLRASYLRAGRSDGEEVEYASMKVGQQVAE